jgi:hypothetical protein
MERIELGGYREDYTKSGKDLIDGFDERAPPELCNCNVLIRLGCLGTY